LRKISTAEPDVLIFLRLSNSLDTCFKSDGRHRVEQGFIPAASDHKMLASAAAVNLIFNG
jgi:hypothetical protein